VTASRAVRSYHLKGALPRGVRRGTRVHFTASGGSASHLAVVSHTRTVRFLARVVSSKHGATVLSLADGSRLALAAPKAKHSKTHKRSVRAHAAGDVTVKVLGLNPGQVVLVTMTLSPDGSELGITIQLVNSGTTGTTGTTGATGTTPADQQATGTVVSVDEDNGVVTVADASGNTTDYALSDALLANTDTLPNECDTVQVSYHADPSDPTALIADSITTTGTDTTSPGCSDTSSGDGSSDQEAIGTVTAVDATAGTISVSTDTGPLAFTADPRLLDGLSVGDQVDVLYATAADGSLTADDVSPVDLSSGS
jgi:hypothetical protein